MQVVSGQIMPTQPKRIHLDPNHKGPTVATLEGLPPKVMRSIKEVHYVARKMRKGFVAVSFENGQRVDYTGDHALFVAHCTLVHDA